jgi:hypothetical protein
VLNETIKRPEILIGRTYKIKPPTAEHALYVTINDMVLNAGTADEKLYPYEIFINSKNMEHFQWVLALTRLASAVFRKGGDICFIIEEMKSVFDPSGGYFKKGGIFMPSLVAEIGSIIETHLKHTGMLKTEGLSDEQKQFLASKRKEFETKNESSDDSMFPANASICKKCGAKAVIMMDGCATCLNCADSRCG